MSIRLRTLSESSAAIWSAIMEVLEPRQRDEAARHLADILAEELSDPLAQCLIGGIVDAEQRAADFEPARPIIAPWHQCLTTINA
jgi:hypothetical protein